MGNVRYLVSGDCAVTVEFGNEISPEINRKIRAFKIALEKEQIEGIVETVPTYRSLLVVYKPEVIRFSALTEKFEHNLLEGLALPGSVLHGQHPDPAANRDRDSGALWRRNGTGSCECGRA